MLALYLMILAQLPSFTSMATFWVFLELSTVSLCCAAALSGKASKKHEFSSSCLLYFSVQSILSVVLLYISNKDLASNLGISLLLEIILYAKMGMFPFHFWVFKVSESFPKEEMLLMLIAHKMPLMMLMFFNGSYILALLCLVGSSYGCISLMGLQSIVSFIVNTSFYGMLWFWVFFMSGFMTFISFLGLYYLNAKLTLSYFSDKGSILSNILIFMFVMSMPPSAMFCMKIGYVCLASGVSASMVLFLGLLVISSNLGYFKFAYSFLMSTKDLYSSMKKSEMVMQAAVLFNMFCFFWIF